MMRFIIPFLIAVALSAQTVTVTSPVIATGVYRAGINQGAQDFYDTGQMSKNLANGANPGFEPTLYHSQVACAAGSSSTNCVMLQDQWYNGGPSYPVGYGTVLGAVIVGGSGYTNGSFLVTSTGGSCSTQPVMRQVFVGGSLIDYYMTNIGGGCSSLPSFAIGSSGGTGASVTPYWFWPPHVPITVISQSVGTPGCTTTGTFQGYTATLPNSAQFVYDTPCTTIAGDYIQVGPSLLYGANYIANDGAIYLGQSNNGYFYGETSDVPPPPNHGVQALALVAPASTDSANVVWTFDNTVQTGGQNFVYLNGTYQIHVQAKTPSSGSMVVIVGRPCGGCGYFNNAGSPQVLTNAWTDYYYTFTASETSNPCGAGACGASINISTLNGAAGTIEIDNVSVQQCSHSTSGGCVTDANTTFFRDEVVSTVQSLLPGTVRMQVATNFATTLNNLLADPTSLMPSDYSTYQVNASDYWDGYTLLQFLPYVEYLGNATEPDVVIPITLNSTDATNLIDWLGGTVSNTSACTGGTAYAIKRCQQGYPAPWTSVFNKIHLELGNEVWNCGNFCGASMNNPVTYGLYADYIFSAMNTEATSLGVRSKFDFVVSGEAAGPPNNQVIATEATHADTLAVGPYTMGRPTDSGAGQWPSTLAEPGVLWINSGAGTGSGGLTCPIATCASAEYTAPAPPQCLYTMGGPSGVTGYWTCFLGAQKLAQKYNYSGGLLSTPLKLSVYEQNIAPQAQASTYNQTEMNAYASSFGAGLLNTLEVLNNIQNGVTFQEFWQLPQYQGQLFANPNAGGATYFLGFGLVTSMGGPNSFIRPNAEAPAAANLGILQGGSMITAVVSGGSGACSGFNGAGYTVSNDNSVTTPTGYCSPNIWSYAFNSGTSYSLELVNSSGSAQTVTLTGAQAPTGSVTVNTLSSSSPNNTNESSQLVNLTTNTVSNPTTVSLPGPYSLVVMTWGATSGPSVNLSPISMSFGSVSLGFSSSSQLETLQNTGSATLNITSISIGGANAGDFAMSGSTCGSTLAASASCSFSVTFTPTAVGSLSASISFVTNAATSPNTVPLTGTGVSGNSCTILNVSTPNQYGSVISWKVNPVASAELQYHQILYVSDSVWASFGSSWSAAMGSSPTLNTSNGLNIATPDNQTSDLGVTLAWPIYNVGPGITGYVASGTLIHFLIISSDTTAKNSSGVFTSANACNNAGGSFTTQAAQTLVNRHPTGPAAYLPPINGVPGNGVGHVWTEGTDCFTFQGCLAAAEGGTINDGVLLTPAAETCVGQYACYLPGPSGANLLSFTIQNAGTGTFTLTSSISSTGWSNGQAVTLAANFGLPAPLQPGPASVAASDPVYYVVSIGVGGANNFQLQDNTHTLVSSVTVGGVPSTYYIEAWPNNIGAYHVVDVNCSPLPPNGVQLNVTQYGNCLKQITFLNSGAGNTTATATNGFSSQEFSSWWILRHLHLKMGATGSIQDPDPRQPLINMAYGSAGGNPDHIVFDQDWIDGPTRPDRIRIGQYITGSYIAWQYSVISNMQFWGPLKNSLLSSASAGHLNLSTGANYYQGTNATQSVGSQATLGGTGVVNAYFSASGVPTLQLGTGVSAGSVTGWTVLPATSITACAFPEDSNGRWSIYPIGCATVASGAVTPTDISAVGGNCYYGSLGSIGQGVYEPPLLSQFGCWNDASLSTYLGGSGPFSDIDNNWSGSGIVGFYFNSVYQNGCSNVSLECNVIPTQEHDIYSYRPTFTFTAQFSQQLANLFGATWDFGYSWERDYNEFKEGNRILIDGAVYNGNIADFEPIGQCQPLFNLPYPTNEGYGSGFTWLIPQTLTDVEVRNSTFNNCPVNIDFTSAYNTYQGNAPVQRVWLHNNVGRYSVNPTLLYSPVAGTAQGTWAAGAGFAQDLLEEHDTVLGRAGSLPSIWNWQNGACIGCTRQNNLTDFTATTGSNTYADLVMAPNSADYPQIGSGLTGLTAAQGVISKDVWVPTWTSWTAPTSWTSGQLSTYQGAWPGVTFALGSGDTYQNNINTINWFACANPTASVACNFRLKSSSPYISGAQFANDGKDAGADIDKLEAAQGKVSNVRAYSLSSTGVTIAWEAPDSFQCYLQNGTGPFWTGAGSFTQTQTSSTGRVQSVTLSGLTAHSQVYGQVVCSAQAKTFTVQLP